MPPVPSKLNRWSLAAPWLAVAVGWVLLESAWTAMLLYHAQILILGWWDPARHRDPGRRFRVHPRCLVGVAAGPLAWFLLPWVMSDGELARWLAEYGLTGGSWVGMAVYFGWIHPVFEQAHWQPLRRLGWPAHLAFAGYHALVLGSLLPVMWVIGIVAGLAGVSWWWAREDTGPAPGTALAMHLLADASIALAALGLVLNFR